MNLLVPWDRGYPGIVEKADIINIVKVSCVSPSAKSAKYANGLLNIHD